MSKPIATDRVTPYTDASPPYHYSSEKSQFRDSRYNPANWSKSSWILLGVFLTIIVAIAIAVGVVEKNNNAYPDYAPLTYSLTDTYSGSSFFDNFDYWSAADPADGFVMYVSFSILYRLPV